MKTRRALLFVACSLAATALWPESARARDDEVWTLPGAATVRGEVEEASPAVEAPAEKTAAAEEPLAEESLAEERIGAPAEAVDAGPAAPGPAAEPTPATEEELPGSSPDVAPAAPVVITGSFTGTIQGTSGATEDAASSVGRVELDFEAACSGAATLFLSVESIAGDGPSANCSNFSELNANAGSTQDPDGADRVLVREAWVELSKGPATVTFGKIDATGFVNANEYANDERAQFLSGAFTNDISLIVPRDGITPGIALVLSRGPLTLALVGTSDDNSGGALFEDLTGIFEVGLAYGREGRAGNLRLHAAVDGAGEDALGEPAGDVGWGVSLDQGLSPTVGLFARAGARATDAADAEVEGSWSVGLDIHAFSKSRPDDNVGIAYGEVTAPAGGATEKLFEIYYRAPLSERSAISGHAQVVADPLCDPGVGTITVLGVRALVEF